MSGLPHGSGSDLSRESCPSLLPGTKGRESRLAHHLHHGNRPLGNGLCHLVMKEGVIEGYLSGVGGEVGKINASQASPVDCPLADRAGFTRAVQFAVFELENAESGTGFADRNHFGVCRRIGCGRNPD